MSSQGRSKQSARAAKALRGARAKGSRRAPAKSGTDIPILAIVVGGILLALFVGLLIFGAINSRTNPIPSVNAASGSIPCDQLEHTQVHYHAFLQIVAQGAKVHIPTDVGRKLGCYYWLHMHTSEEGIIHIESPADRTFTLGDFFDVWSAWGGVPELWIPRTSGR